MRIHEEKVIFQDASAISPHQMEKAKLPCIGLRAICKKGGDGASLAKSFAVLFISIKIIECLHVHYTLQILKSQKPLIIPSVIFLMIPWFLPSYWTEFKNDSVSQ